MSNQITDIKLKYPIEIDGVECEIIKMRQPKVKDMLNAEKNKGSDSEKEIKLFSDLCSCSPSDLENLYLYDYKKIQEVYQDFLS